MKPSDEELTELLKADNRRYETMIAGDTDALAELLADELLYTHSSGNTDTKEQYLETIRSGYVVYRSSRVATLSDNAHWGTFNTIIEPVIVSWVLPHNLYVRAGLAVAVDDATSTPGNPPSGNGAPSSNGFWSLLPDFGVSWLYDGWNVSAGLQYAYNFKDSATQYKTGQQLAGTYMVTKTIGKWTFGVGAYSINQITSDTGAGAEAAGCAVRGGCKIEAYGAGPLLSYQFGGASILVNYTRSIYTRNYLGGNIVNLRLIVPLG